MKEIGIRELLELINKAIPNGYYSILDIDALMPRAEMPDGSPAYEQINNAIKNYTSGYTTDFASLLEIVKQFDDVMVLWLVVNKNKREIIGGDDNECRKYADNSLLQISIEDLDLVKLVSSDKYLELSLRAKLGELPIRITTG